MKIFLLTIFVSHVHAIEFSSRSRNFSIELLHHTQQELGGHVVISPLAIYTLLTVLELGADGNSESQISRALRSPKDPITLLNFCKNLIKTVINPGVEEILTSKSLIFIDSNFDVNPTYKETITSQLDVALEKIYFDEPNSAALLANYIIKESGVSLTDVLTSDDFTRSKMIVANIIKFKGLWASPFETSDTEVAAFYDENNKKIGEVNMMYQRTPIPSAYIKALNSDVIEMPYGNDFKYSMLVILPNYKIKVTDVYEKLQTVYFDEILAQLKSEVDKFGLRDVDVKLPRFKITSDIVLNVPLNKMGIFDIFNENLANLTNITDKSIHVSAIVHKADVEVTESGILAFKTRLAINNDDNITPEFEANRPFIYFIIEKSTTTLIFGGIYSQPVLF